MYAIVAIRYELPDSIYITVPTYLEIIEDVFQFVFVIGIFTGILLGFMNWHKLGGQEVYGPPTGQYPYGVASAPYSVPQGYQQPQVYQQQPHVYQQQPQVYQQQPRY